MDGKEAAEKQENSNTEKVLTEKRAALISALIAIPAAVLIAMLIHFFVDIPEEPLFQCNPQISDFNEKQLPLPSQKTPVQNPVQKTRQTAEDLTGLYQKKIAVARAVVNEMEKDFKSGKIPLIQLVSAKTDLLLADGSFYRYQNKIRVWGHSVSDLAVRYETAKRIAKEKLLRYKAGIDGFQSVKNAEMSALDLEIQLKSHRVFSNPEWQKSYKEYLKRMDKESYFAMISAEQTARPRRRF